MLALLVPGTAAAQGKPAAPAAEGRWIVVYDRASVDSVNRETDAQERRRGFRSRLRFSRAIEGFAARLSADQVRALRADPDVEAVVPDRIVRASAAAPRASGEPLSPNGIRRIGAATPDWVREASDVGVAVVDTGIDLDHPDLNVADGVNCVTPGASADDDEGHGTHVAGTVGARNDGAGVTGVAPGTRVHAVKVLNAAGEGLDSQVICGIDWTIANAGARGIRVLNMSFGHTNESNRNCGRASEAPGSPLVDPLHEVICRATAAGLLSVVAAGNNAWNISEFEYDVPASYPEVLTVSAMSDGDGAPGGATPPPSPPCGNNGDDVLANFSNFTRAPEEARHMIAAPGVCITSTWPGGGYNTISGTSMAAPHVAGAAALCVGEAGEAGPCAGMSPAQMIERLRADAESFRVTQLGSGFTGDANAPPDRVYGPLVRPVTNGPQTAITATPPDTTADTTPTFEFSSPTPGTRFVCSIDGGAFGPCGSPATTRELPEGPHTFAVQALDVAGTPDPTPAAHSFVVDLPDTTPPLVSYSTSSRQRIATVSRQGIRVSVSCSEACGLESSVVISGKEARRLKLVRRSTEVIAGRRNAALAPGRRTLVIKLTSAVRRQLARNRVALVQVRIVARDAAGNARTVRKTVRLVR